MRQTLRKVGSRSNHRSDELWWASKPVTQSKCECLEAPLLMRSFPSRLRADLPCRSVASVATSYVGAHRSPIGPQTGPQPIAGKATQGKLQRDRTQPLPIGRQCLVFDLLHNLVGTGLPQYSRVLSVAEGEGSCLPGIQDCWRRWLRGTLTRQEQ